MDKKKKKVNWGFRIWRFLTFCFVLSLVFSYLSEYIDPGNFWVFAFFGLAYPFILLINIGLVIFWGIKKNWLAVLPLAFIVLGYKEFSRTVSLPPFVSKVKPSSSKTLKILTFNAHSFRPLDSRNDAQVREEILGIIRKESPDIMGIQEFYTRKRGEYDILDSLKKILNKPYYYYHKVDSNKIESRGMAIFSKYPLSHIVLLGFDKSQTVNGIIQADIRSPQGLFRIYCVHLQSIDFRPVDYAYLSRIKEKIKPELHPTTRILGKLKLAFIKRAEQANLINESIQHCTMPVLVMGDFNDTPVSYSYKTILGNLKSCFENSGAGFGRTYNGSFPNFQIDHILCDTLFEVSGYKIIEKKLSDHYPVRVHILLHRKP